MSIDRMLKGHDLFGSLTVEEANRLSGLSAAKDFVKGENIFKISGKAAHVYMLMKGTVDLLLPANPPDFSFVISRIEKGELFGLSPLLDSPRYTTTAVCASDSQILAIEAKPLREMLLANAPVGFNIMSQVAHVYFNRYVDVMKSLQNVISQVPLIR